MEALPTKLSRVGNSVVIYIPGALARFLKFEVGQVLHVRIVPNGEYFDADVRQFGRGSIGILVPRPIIVKHGLTPVPTKKEFDAGATWDGETILVPFGDWTVVTGPPGATVKPAPTTPPAPRSKRTRSAKKKAKHATDDEDHAGPGTRDKKSPRSHAGHKGHAHGRGSDDDHHRAYGRHGDLQGQVRVLGL